jgi:hypothetical protein
MIRTDTKSAIPTPPLSPNPKREKIIYARIAPIGVDELNMSKCRRHSIRVRDVDRRDSVNAKAVGAIKFPIPEYIQAIIWSIILTDLCGWREP